MPLRLLTPRFWHTWIGLGVLWVFTLLPWPALHVMGRALGYLAWGIGRTFKLHHVRIAKRNIDLCLPELSAAQRQVILREHIINIGMTVFETSLSWWGSNARIQRLTEVVGMEHLHSALARDASQGHGMILLSAHFTTLELGARALAARLPLNVMYRPTNNPVMTRFLERNRALRTRRAIKRDDVRTLIAALKANEAVWYAPDQAYRSKGAQMVPFFGLPCATNTATSRLAGMTGALVLPYFPERLPNGRYRMHILPALDHFPSDDAVADTARYHALIEAHVRRVPAQYLWVHRRFKGLSADYPDYYSQQKKGQE